jgi:hypothetical protein
VAFTAGTSTAVTVQIQTAGVPQATGTDQAVTFTTSSARGAFSTTATGPWSPTLSVTIAAGSSSTSVYYSDTLAGSPTVSASLPGQPATVQSQTVTAATAARVDVTPSSATILTGKAAKFAAIASDAYGNPVAAPVTWRLSSTALGRLTGTTGSQVTFVASNKAGRVTLAATSGAFRAAATITVTRPPARLASVGVRSVAGHIVATARVVRGTSAAAGVPVTLRVRRGSHVVVSVRGLTKGNGTLTWRSRARLPRAHYVASAAIRSASTASRTQQRST